MKVLASGTQDEVVEDAQEGTNVPELHYSHKSGPREWTFGRCV